MVGPLYAAAAGKGPDAATTRHGPELLRPDHRIPEAIASGENSEIVPAFVCRLRFYARRRRGSIPPLTTNCISRCLTVPDAGQLVEDLRQIRRLILAGAPLTLESRIQPGTPVRVRSGPLLGVEGVVVRRQNRERLLVAVRFLQQGASLLLEDFQVEPI